MSCLTSSVGTGVADDQLKSCTIPALASPLTSLIGYAGNEVLSKEADCGAEMITWSLHFLALLATPAIMKAWSN